MEENDVTKMNKRLAQDLGDKINVDEFNTQLKKTGSIIAGSYPLQVFHNLTWMWSDIDIFTNNLAMLYYLEQHLGRSTILKRGHYNHYNHHDGNYTFLRCRVYEFHSGPKPIQLIYMFNKATNEEVVQKFDFEFCRAAYDGEKLELSEAAKNKEGAFDCSKRQATKKTLSRLSKYEKRGFKVTNRAQLVEQAKQNADECQDADECQKK